MYAGVCKCLYGRYDIVQVLYIPIERRKTTILFGYVFTSRMCVRVQRIIHITSPTPIPMHTDRHSNHWLQHKHTLHHCEKKKILKVCSAVWKGLVLAAAGRLTLATISDAVDAVVER